MAGLQRTHWSFCAGLAVLLCLTFMLGHSGQLSSSRRQRGGGIFHRNILARELKDQLQNGLLCSQGPVIRAGGQAAFSKPSSQETLFSVVPKGISSGRAPEQACPVVTVLSIVRDAGSWGDGGRDFIDFIQVLNDIADDGATLDLALSVESKKEFDAIVCSIVQLYKLDAPSGSKCKPSPRIPVSMAGVPLSGIRIFHVPSLQGDPHPAVLNKVSREQRGLHPAQKARRRWLARNRNRLAWGAAKDQAAFLWLDTDIAQLPQGMLAAMLNSGKDVIAPVVRCNFSGGVDYFDKNTWIGPIQPGFSDAERQHFRTSDDAWPGFKALHIWNGRWGPGLHYLDDPRYKDEQLVPVTSVGGAVLFVRPYVFQQGANFGIANMVGGDWENEGWDSIETEALCWMATKAGFSCWGMPNQEAWHVPCNY